MRHWILALILILGACTARAEAAAKDAVVRITSHGASGTVIWTGPGRTLILSCAHMLQTKADRARRFVIDAPAPLPGAKRTGGIRLLKIDYQLDLTLIEMGVGPLPYVCPVPSSAHRPSRNIISVGYDEMRPKVTVRTATLLGSDREITWTRERPWHGRSGGALIDQNAGVLIGVVQGYEVAANGRGMYGCHEAIRLFLGYRKAAALKPAPRTTESREYTPPGTEVWDIRPSCPDYCPDRR